jgi:hypothetical protein
MDVFSGYTIPAFRRYVTVSKQTIEAGFDVDIIPTDCEIPRKSYQNSWFATQDVNQRPPEYKTGFLLTLPRPSA